MSEKYSITIEVDGSLLFDMVRDMKGNTGPLGDRLVGLLLSGVSKPDLRDAIGLSVYGITVGAHLRPANPIDPLETGGDE